MTEVTGITPKQQDATNTPQKKVTPEKISAPILAIKDMKVVDSAKTVTRLEMIRQKLGELKDRFSLKTTTDINEKSPYNTFKFPRRQGLKTTAATAVMRGVLPNVRFQEMLLEQKATQLDWKEVATDEQLDLNYVHTLIEELCKDRGTPESRKYATIQNLRQVVYPLEKPKQIGNGLPSQNDAATILMVDESGIYIGAGHSALKPDHELRDTAIAVLNPQTGEVNPVKNFVVDRVHDIAIFYSPTGKERKPVANLQLSLEVPKNGEVLSSVGISNENKPYEVNSIDLETGEVLNEAVDMEGYEGAVLVKNMITKPGASGGPVYDTGGKIKAVNSGTYDTKINNVVKLQLGRVTPLAHLKGIRNQPVYTYSEENKDESESPWIVIPQSP